MAARKGRPAVGSSLGSPRGSSFGTGATGDRATGAGADRAGTGGRAGGRGRASRPVTNFTRPALAPGLIAAIVLLACVAFLDAPAFVAVRWGVTVLALIILVFALRGRAWWALAVTAAIAVCWNPLVTVPIPGQVWAALQIVAAALFVVMGLAVKVPRTTEAPVAR
ncbi:MULTISPECIES: DUF6804 family protein [unclassified Curtobacterium]|uniref:DUF6804 family protein n=1 Tax=unclassified Curtobacterium TaxID=257496 RepID=UPI00226B7097|nr:MULTISPECIES: DUF6804 family protein [unclassified Curtobacterium]